MASRLVCPCCSGRLLQQTTGVACEQCARHYPRVGRVICFELGADDAASVQRRIYDAKAMRGALLRPEPSPRLGRYPDLLLTYREHGRQVRAMNLKRGDRVLDVGCSTGTMLRSLSHAYGAETHGLDVSLQSLTVAADLFPQGRWYQGSAEHLPFETGSFDAVCAFDVLEHVRDFAGAVGEIARVLRSGGTALFHIPVADIGGSFDALWKKYRPAQYATEQQEAGHFPQNMRSKDELVTRCEAVGFEVLCVRRFNVMLQNIFDYRIRHRILGRMFNGRRLPFTMYHSLFAPIVELVTVVPDRAIATLTDIGASIYLQLRLTGEPNRRRCNSDQALR